MPSRRKSSPFQGQQPNGRPKLRFSNPKETEEFVLSQPKTDYTYSTSPSYSSTASTMADPDDEMDGYSIPYMSRPSYKNSSYVSAHRSQQPSVTPSGRQPSADISASRRRSARLAGRPLDNPPPAAHNTSSQYPSYSGLKPSRGHSDSTDGYHGNSRGRGLHRAPNSSSRSGLFSEKDFGSDDQSLTHLYGLDEFDETELSDTESSQANQKYSSSSSDSSDWSERRSSINVMSVIKIIIITTIYITTFIPRTAYNYYRSRSSTSTPKPSKLAGQSSSSFIHSVAHTLYTLVTSTLLMDVWFLTRTRSWLSGVGVTTPVTAGLKQGSSFTSLSSYSQQEIRERRRQRGGFPCWLCLLLLLLPILSSLYLFWGFVPFLMPLAANETNETQHIAAATDDIGVILTGLGDSPPPAAGCLQCLTKEDLSLMMVGLMKETTNKWQQQILEQEAQILVMLKQGAEQDAKINRLSRQVEEYQLHSASSTLEPASDSSIEKEVMQMRADLRNLMHASPRDDTQIPEHVSSSIQTFRGDLDRLSSKLSELGNSFEESKNSQAAIEVTLKNTQEEMGEKAIEAMTPFYSLRDKFSLQLGDLEGRLEDLKNLLVVLESSSDNRQGQIDSIVKQINNFEADIVEVKATLRTLDGALSNMRTNIGDMARTDAISELRAELGTQRSDITELRSMVSQNDKNFGGIDLEVKSLRVGIAQLEAERLALEKSYSSDKETFRVLLQKTSEANSERIKKLSTDVESKFQVTVDGRGASDEEGLARLQQSMSQQHEDFRNEIRKNAEALHDLEVRLSGLSDALNNTDEKTDSGLMVVNNLQAIEGSLQDLKLQVEAMQSLQASVDGSSSISEAVLAQVTKMRASLASMEGKIDNAEKSVGDLATDVDGIEKSLGLLQGQTASKSGSPINFITMETNVDMLQESISGLEAAVEEIKLKNSNQDSTIQAALADSGTVKEQITTADGSMVNVVLMQSNFQMRIDNMGDTIASLREDVDRQGDGLGLVLTDRDNQYHSDQMQTINADIVNIREILTSLEGLSMDSGDSSGIAAQLIDLGSKVTALEAGLVLLQSGKGDSDLAGLLAGLQTDLDELKKRVDKIQDSEHTASCSGGLGVSGSLHDDEGINSLKSDMSKLNAQYNSLNLHMSDCCRNKSDMAGMGFMPGINYFAADTDVNISGDTEKIKVIVYDILNQYSADKTGMVDYALESAGGSVVSTRCSETYTSKTALLSIFGIPLWYVTNSARIAIQPDVHPGNCWAFKGAIGFLVIQLSDTIQPTYFTMEHIPKSLSPSGKIPSAPRNFSVWALKDEHDMEGVLLGEYVYDDNGLPVQVFPVENVEVKPTMMVELKIHSNYGSLEYTCLYRFRVHGDLYRP